MTKLESLGAVSFKVGETDYSLLFGWQELAKVEKSLGMKLFAFANYFDDEANMSAGSLIKIFHIALSRHHPDLTEEQAADIMTASHGEFLPKLAEAVEQAFPKPAGGNGDARPTLATSASEKPSSSLPTSSR